MACRGSCGYRCQGGRKLFDLDDEIERRIGCTIAEYFEKHDFHLHVPEGAVPKDGPSAGVALTTAIVSLLTKQKVDHTLGMTGEITLRGRVLPIGGLREKSIAAHRSGLKKILIPAENVKDIEDVPASVLEELQIIPVTTAEEVLEIALIK